MLTFILAEIVAYLPYNSLHKVKASSEMCVRISAHML